MSGGDLLRQASIHWHKIKYALNITGKNLLKKLSKIFEKNEMVSRKILHNDFVYNVWTPSKDNYATLCYKQPKFWYKIRGKWELFLLFH